MRLLRVTLVFIMVVHPCHLKQVMMEAIYKMSQSIGAPFLAFFGTLQHLTVMRKVCVLSKTPWRVHHTLLSLCPRMSKVAPASGRHFSY